MLSELPLPLSGIPSLPFTFEIFFKIICNYGCVGMYAVCPPVCGCPQGQRCGIPKELEQLGAVLCGAENRP